MVVGLKPRKPTTKPCLIQAEDVPGGLQVPVLSQRVPPLCSIMFRFVAFRSWAAVIRGALRNTNGAQTVPKWNTNGTKWNLGPRPWIRQWILCGRVYAECFRIHRPRIAHLSAELKCCLAGRPRSCQVRMQEQSFPAPIFVTAEAEWTDAELVAFRVGHSHSTARARSAK